TEREAKREQAGKPPAMSVPSINEPRFVSESYFMDFKFEPGNYYLAGKETLDGHEVLKIDYLPTKLFHEDGETSEDAEIRKERDKEREKTKEEKAKEEKEKAKEQKTDKRSAQQKEKDAKEQEK